MARVLLFVALMLIVGTLGKVTTQQTAQATQGSSEPAPPEQSVEDTVANQWNRLGGGALDLGSRFKGRFGGPRRGAPHQQPVEPSTHEPSPPVTQQTTEEDHTEPSPEKEPTKSKAPIEFHVSDHVQEVEALRRKEHAMECELIKKAAAACRERAAAAK